MSAERFIDTNIWIYAHLEQENDPKWQRANALVEADPRYVISTQVLNEYYAAMLRNQAEDAWIQGNIESMIEHCEVRLLTLETIRQAHQLRLRYGFSYWDSLILSSALDAGCGVLYSEDMQHGQVIGDKLQILNPFLDKA